jgi:hypothetical protein
LQKCNNALGEVNDVTISWIKAHIEHPGNELADKQAKAGTIPRHGPRPWHWELHPEPNSILKSNIKTKINEQWQIRWTKNPVCWQSKCFIQNISKNTNKFDKLLKTSNRDTIGKLIQFITGHCNLNYHQKKLITGLKLTCRFCQDKEEVETPIHLIQNCKSLIPTRREFFDLQSVLLDNFDWSTMQLLGFLHDSQIWGMLDWSM